MEKKNLWIPADVPAHAVDDFIKNYHIATRSSKNCFVFSVDQKLEHLNDYFYGPTISNDDCCPEHLFNIANAGFVGVMATHPGLINRYGKYFKNIYYVAKLSGKTHLIPPQDKDPMSTSLATVQDIVRIKTISNLPIIGVSQTIYPGSIYENEMIQNASRMILDAHQHGLLAFVWIYPRGAAIKNEKDGNLIAGAAGLATTLGADFVKLHQPEASSKNTSNEWFKIAQQAAGSTKILSAGGEPLDPKDFLTNLYYQLREGGIHGCAVGRNIHQKSLDEAITFTQAIAALIYHNSSLNDALSLL